MQIKTAINIGGLIVIIFKKDFIMQIELRDIIDLRLLENHEVLTLISELTSELGRDYELPKKASERVQAVIYSFIEDFESK